jgi:cytochrome c oxidase subunit 2
VGRTNLLVVLLGALFLLLAGSALAGNAGFAPPDSVSSSGSAINQLYWIIIGITAVIFLLVEGALLWFIFRFRRRPGTAYDAEAPQIHGNTRLEVLWTLVPVVIVIGIVVATVIKVPAVNAKPAHGSDSLVIRVEAHTFYWEYTYPNGVVAVDTLTLPIERPVRLELTGLDVIHSWWVPEITGKRDAIPGRINTLDFEIDRTGTFVGQCAEFCGVEHAVMYTTVEAVPQGVFDEWYQSQALAQAKPAETQLGRQTWVGVCAKCHGLDGQGGYGPAIAGNSTLADPRVLAQLLANGQDNDANSGFMPPVSTGWPQKQLDSLLAYLQQSGLAPKRAG